MDRTISYTVADDVFARYPAYRVGVVLARNVSSGASGPELTELFDRTCQELRATVDIDALATDHRIRPWREAFRAFGAKPSDYRPSIEALARRVLRTSLSPLGQLIDIGTVISLRHLIPVGGHALTDLAGPIELRPATGQETFRTNGSAAPEHPTPGEIILTEGNIVLTRRWVWRQSGHSAIQPDTQHLFYNVDVLPEDDTLDAKAIAAELAELLGEHAGGDITIDLLHAAHPRLELTV